MKNRIQIDGVWYVKEEIKDEKPSYIIHLNSNNVSSFQGFNFESDLYAWEAIRYLHADGKPFDHIDIKFTDKRVKPFREEIWDHTNWMRAILDNELISLEELRKSVCSRGETEFIAFLKYLRYQKWI